MGNNLCKDNVNNLQFRPSKINKKDEKYWNKYILETCTPMDPKETLRISNSELKSQPKNNMENIPIAPPRKKRTKLTLKNNQSDLIIKNGFRDVFYNENSIIYDNNYKNNINTTNNNNYKHFYNSLSPNSKEKLKTINIGNRKSDKFFGENLYDSLANDNNENSPTSPNQLDSTQITYTSKSSNTEAPIFENNMKNKINNNYQISKEANNVEVVAKTVSVINTEKVPALVTSINDNKINLLDQKSKFLLTMLSDHDDHNLRDNNETMNNNEIPKITPRKNKNRYNYNNKTPEKPQRTFAKLNNENNIKKQRQPTLTRNISLPHTNLYFQQHNTNNNHNNVSNNSNNINNDTDTDIENKEKIVNFLKKCKSSNSFLTEIIMDDIIRKVYDFNINSDYWLNDNHTYCDDGICDGSTVFIPKTVNNKTSTNKPKFSIGNAEIIKNKEEKSDSEDIIGNELDIIILKDKEEVSLSENISNPNSIQDELIEKEVRVKFVETDILEDKQTITNLIPLINNNSNESITKIQSELIDMKEKSDEEYHAIDPTLPTEKFEDSEKGPIGYEIECQQPVSYKIEPHIRKVSVTCSLPSISEDESKSNEDLQDINLDINQDEISTCITPESPDKTYHYPFSTEDLLKLNGSPLAREYDFESENKTNDSSIDTKIVTAKGEDTTTNNEKNFNEIVDNRLSNIIEAYDLEDIYKNKNNILNEFQNFLKSETQLEKCDNNTEIAKSNENVIAETDVKKINSRAAINDDDVTEIVSNEFMFAEIPKHKSKEMFKETETKVEKNDKVKIVELIEKNPKKPKRKRSQSISDYRSDSIEDLDLWFSKHSDSAFKNKSLKSVIHGSRMGRRGSEGNCASDTRKLYPFGTRDT